MSEQNQRQEKIEPRRMMVNPYSIWPVESFAKMVDRICNEEVVTVLALGHPGPSDEEREDMRSMITFNINAHVVPAGNA